MPIITKYGEYVSHLTFKNIPDFSTFLDPDIILSDYYEGPKEIDFNGEKKSSMIVLNTSRILKEKENNSYDFMYKDTKLNAIEIIKNYFSFENKYSINPDQNTLKILKDGAYLKGHYYLSLGFYPEFTLSFYYRISRNIFLNPKFFDTSLKKSIYGISWNNNKILLYDSIDYKSSNFYKNKCLSLIYGDVKYNILFDYELYNGTDWILFTMTATEHKRIRVFINGKMYLNELTNINVEDFSNLIIGNYNLSPDISETNNFEPEVEFGEFAIYNKCLYTEDFDIKNQLPINLLYLEKNESYYANNDVHAAIIRYNNTTQLSPNYYNAYSQN